MASRFKESGNEMDSFCMFIIDKISTVDNNEKIDYLAQLCRCFLINELDSGLFMRLWKTINDCTVSELGFLRDANYGTKYKDNFTISILRTNGIFEKSNDGDAFVLSSLGKAIKQCSLNYNESHGKIENRIENLEPIKNVNGSINYDEIDELLEINNK